MEGGSSSSSQTLLLDLHTRVTIFKYQVAYDSYIQNKTVHFKMQSLSSNFGQKKEPLENSRL